MQIFSLSQGNSTSDKQIFESLIKEADTNGDGELSLKEFTTMMEKFMNTQSKNK